MRPLNTSDFDVLNIRGFKRAYPRDRIPVLKIGESCVCNLHTAEKNGSHWVFYKREPKRYVYADSFGVSAFEAIKKQVKGKKCVYLNSQVQDMNTSTSCGWFCLYFLIELSKGRSYEDIVYDFDIHNLNKNERLLEAYFRKLKMK
jgi:hypothetical protein